MATTTTNLGLTLPAGTDPADIAVLNTNFGLIDTFAGQQTAKDTSQDARMTAIENDATDRDGRLTALETSDTTQNGRLTALETSDTSQDGRLTAIETKNTAQDDRLTTLEQTDTAHAARLTAIEAKDTAQDAAIAAKLNTADVDDALSSTSTDPVQNKVVYAELESIKASARVLTLGTTTFTSLAAYADSFANGTYSFLVPNNNTLPDVPMNNTPAIVKLTVYSASTAMMEFCPISSVYNGQLFTQIKSGGTWRGWYKFEGTVVT